MEVSNHHAGLRSHLAFFEDASKIEGVLGGTLDRLGVKIPLRIWQNSLGEGKSIAFKEGKLIFNPATNNSLQLSSSRALNSLLNEISKKKEAFHSIEFNNCNFLDLDVANFADELNKSHVIQSITFDNVEISAQDLETFLNHCDPSKNRIINFSLQNQEIDQNTSDTLAKYFHKHQGLKKLTLQNLTKNGIDLAPLFNSLKSNFILTSLNLSSTILTISDRKALPQLVSTAYTLDNLDLSNTHFILHDLFELTKNLMIRAKNELASPLILNLSNNPINCSGVEQMLNSSIKIKQLNMEHTQKIEIRDQSFPLLLIKAQADEASRNEENNKKIADNDFTLAFKRVKL